jgi:Ca2+-binding EF-hand superfamily protein
MLRTLAAAMLAATSLVAALAVAQPQDGPAAERPAREPMTRTAVEQRAAAMFARLDTDGDARITPADRAARSGERQDGHFSRLDADGNGAISREEFAAGADQRAERRSEHRPRREHARMGGQRGPRGGAQRILAGADSDSDGAVTQAEFASAMLARFDAADTDRNGTIEADERRARGRPDRPATR